MRHPRRRWVDLVLLLAFLGALGNWVYARYQQRQTAAEVEEIAILLDIGPLSRVADVGAGSGRFAVPIARRIAPDGYVYATEIDLGRLEDIRRAVASENLQNVTLLEARVDDTGLPPGCCDAVLLRTVYHHLTEPTTIGADLFNALRPGGRLLVIDFASQGLLSFFAPVEGVPENRGGHGIPPSVVIEELTQVGFQLERQIDEWWGNNYGLVFTRDAT